MINYTKYDGLYANCSVDNHINYSTMKFKCELTNNFFLTLLTDNTLTKFIPISIILTYYYSI